MVSQRTRFDLTRFGDALLVIGATAYFTSFIAAIEIALGKLSY